MVAIIFAAAFGTLALSFWPYMIPFSITIDDAAAPHSSLAFMFWGAGLFVFPLMLLYTATNYSVFRGKNRPERDHYPLNQPQLRGAAMSKRVADVLVETLQAAGVKRCYGIVGDTLNQIAHAIDRSAIQWVHMRHEEAGAFAAGAEAQLTGRLTACAGSCGPGSLHFINGLYEANRNRAPVILIASQIVRQDLGFESIQEVDFVDVYRGCSVFCEMILTPEQARRKTVAACQAALTRRGVAVLVVPVDVANAAAHNELPYTVHARRPLIRPSDADLDEIAAILNKSKAITIYAGAGCAGAHDEVVATAARLKAPMAHTSRGKDFVEYDNPYNVGMTGMIGGPAGYHAILDCDVLLLLGADFAWTQFYPDSATIIQIDADPTHIGRRHPVAIGAVGDIKTTLDALLPRLAATR